MIFLKTSDEIELLRQANLLVGKALAEVAKILEPGVTTRQLDRVAEEFIRDILYLQLLDKNLLRDILKELSLYNY